MKRAVKILAYTGGGFLAFLFFILSLHAYSPHYTHPDLTEEMVKFYNALTVRQKIAENFIPALRQGSIDEDIAPRWINHFYDPQSGEGWTGEHLGPHDKEKVQVATRLLIAANFTPMPAPQWALDQEAQNKFINYGWNHTWQKAIYDYVNGNTEKAMESLGYVLHLIEDMSVPDHTRNDSHPHVAGDPGSPYEEWVKQYTNTHNLDIAERLVADKESIPHFSKLQEAFDYVAKYSNENFFSEETIVDPKYDKPTYTFFIDKGTVRTYYNKDKFGTYPLAISSKLPDDTIKYTLNDSHVLSSYFNRLSRRAVLGGAGVIDLFFREAEKTKNNPSLLEQPPSPPNSGGTIGLLILTRIISPLGEAYKIIRPVTAIVRNVKTFIEKQADGFKKVILGMAGVLYSIPGPPSGLKEEGSKEAMQIVAQDAAEIVSRSVSKTESESAGEQKPAIEQNPTSTQKPTIASEPDIASEPKNASTPKKSPESLTVESQPSQDSSFLSSNSLGGNDTAAEGYGVNESKQVSAHSAVSSVVVFAPFVPGAGAAPPPSQNTAAILSPAEETFSVSENTQPPSSEEKEEDKENEEEKEEKSDEKGEGRDEEKGVGNETMNPENATTTIPDLAFSIAECEESLSEEGCLVATTTLTLLWSSHAQDLKHFELNLNGVVSTTTATSTIYFAPEDFRSYTFQVKAVDDSGNFNEKTQTVEIATLPVVINEIAWMGTKASHADEWIELYNNTEKEISLEGWVLLAEDGVPYLNLSGTIPAHGFYLIERGEDDETISDISADLAVPFSGAGSGSGLANLGEELLLLRASTTIDRTPKPADCSGVWCSGDKVSKRSMERYDPLSSGGDKENWGTFQGFLANGKDADGNNIQGTPKQRNSLNYLISVYGSFLNQDKILTPAGNPYIVPNVDFLVSSGTTLTLEPGVIVKFMDRGSLTAEGALKAQGTSEKKIVFTSFKDDSYGGDTNQDATSTLPEAGDWSYIKIKNNNSILDNILVRFGGADIWGDPKASVVVENSSLAITNSLIEESETNGLMLKNASGTIENNIFKNNGRASDGSGVFIEDGNFIVSGNTFENNVYGLRIISQGSPHAISVTDNSFAGNSSFAIQVINAFPVFSGNSIPQNDNGINGINLQGVVTKDYTLSADLPFVIQNNVYKVQSGKTLTISPGTVLKLDGVGSISVAGKLVAEGTNTKKIVFTSLKDDEYGGDTNHATTTPVAGDWLNIFLDAGSSSSTLKNVIIRYGGRPDFSTVEGSLIVRDSSVEIQDSIFERNRGVGIHLINSTSTVISNSIIQGFHDEPKPQGTFIGLLIASSTPILKDTIFRNNSIGILASGPNSSVVDGGGIEFIDNEASTSPPGLLP